MTPLKIAITPGEPAGVGPDLVIELAQQEWPAQLVIFADETMMQERAAALPMAKHEFRRGENCLFRLFLLPCRLSPEY